MAAGDEKMLWAVSSAACPEEQLCCDAAPEEGVELHFAGIIQGIYQTGAAL